MSEQEPPEIPEHLKDDLPSVEAYEQEARREFQITDLARKLMIPQESMETNPTVSRYVAVLRDAEAALERLRGYRTKDLLAGDRRVQERTGQAAALYHAEKIILEEGFPTVGEGSAIRRIDLDPMRHSSLTAVLDRAAQPYGVAVDVPEGWRKEQFHDFVAFGEPFRPTPEPAAGLWTGAPLTTEGAEPWQREGDNFWEWYWPDKPNQRHDAEHVGALVVEGARHGIRADQRHDPIMHTLLTSLLYGRNLTEETQGLHGLPPAPGLTPSAHKRLTRVAPLNTLAVAMLEDAIVPGTLTRAHVAAKLQSISKPYGLIVRT